ncbi:MAG: glutathione S-transferase family protein [Acidobacteria bacterium]|nr:MAG: glutathione S-transferase family protein [Acidobacteriota bacterium]
MTSWSRPPAMRCSPATCRVPPQPSSVPVAAPPGCERIGHACRDPSMTLRLYQIAGCPYCRKVSRALEQLGLEYQVVEIDPDLRSEVKKISGQEKVPVLVDGDRVITDSTAILRHLVDYSSGGELLPEDSRHQALAWILEAYADDTLVPLVARSRDSQEDRAELAVHLAWLEQFLDPGGYILGDAPTLADLALHAAISGLERDGQGPPLSTELSRLCSWYGRLRS